MTKIELLSTLSFDVDSYHFRKMDRKDIDLRCDWPSYPNPYEGFNSSLREKSEVERDKRFNNDDADIHKLIIAVNDNKGTLIGTFGLIDINWLKLTVGNMGIRLHPNWCDKGIGTHLLVFIMQWLKRNCFSQVSLDVIESNQRARKCYCKVGFIENGFLVRDTNKFLLMTLSLKKNSYEL